jgi:hypothetical protein
MKDFLEIAGTAIGVILGLFLSVPWFFLLYGNYVEWVMKGKK